MVALLFVWMLRYPFKTALTAGIALAQIGEFSFILAGLGVSLGMFEATSPEMRWGLVLVTALIALVVTVWMMREKLLADILALSLILGGALGNIKDRYDLGYVVDFADLHFGEFRPFLIFNVADAAITIGVVIVLARAFFMGDKDKAEVDGLMNSKAADAAESK